MTYHINAKIERDIQKEEKYGLSIRNVSITCSEYKDSYFIINGEIIVNDSKKADNYISYNIDCTAFGKGKKLGDNNSKVITFERKKDSFTTTLFHIPFDDVDKIQILVEPGAPTPRAGNMGNMDFQHEMDMMDLEFQHEMDMMDLYFFD